MSQNNTATQTVTLNVADLVAKEKELRELEAQLKEVTRIAEMDAVKTAVNPDYVPGSLRRPTADDRATLGSRLHAAWVGDIKCSICGQLSVRNAGDLHQVHTCEACTPAARKQAGKTKRAQKRLTKLVASTGNIDDALTAKREALEALKAKLATKS